MLAHYFTIVSRSIARNLQINLINIFGLTVGVLVALIISVYVVREYTFDHFHVNGRNIFKVEFNAISDGKDFVSPSMSYDFGNAIKSISPEIISYSRLVEPSFYDRLIESDQKVRDYEAKFFWADNNFFKLFSFEMISGNVAEALSRPGTVVITKAMADKYFPGINPIGHSLIYDKKYPYEIVGVIKNIPVNSSIKFDFLGDIQSYRSLEKEQLSNFLSGQDFQNELNNIGATGPYHTFFLLHSESSAPKIEKRIPALLSPFSKLKNKTERYSLYPLYQLHFDRIDKKANETVLIFTIIGILVLLVGIINYANLSTAKSITRLKEMSVRKIVGANRLSLIAQVYIESIVFVTISYILAITLFFVLGEKILNGLSITIDTYYDMSLVSVIFISYVMCLVVSGLYPAILLSGFNPISGIRGTIKSRRTPDFRKVFTTLQFTVSIGLIICSISISKQMELFTMDSSNVNRESIVTVFLDEEDEFNKYYRSILHELNDLSSVQSISSSNLPMYSSYSSEVVFQSASNNQKIPTKIYKVDSNFTNTLSLKFVENLKRNPSFVSQKNDIIINQKAANYLGIKSLSKDNVISIAPGHDRRITGIVEDFHFASMAEAIQPLALEITGDTVFKPYLYIKISPTSYPNEALSKIQKIYDRFKKNRNFSYRFLDDTYNSLYKTESDVLRMVKMLTYIAIIISCLGLYALTTFTLEQRQKEIGIRKVLGAEFNNIVYMFSVDIIKLIVLALLIASPITFILVRKWLENFEYRITINLYIFILAAGCVSLLALLTIGYQVVRVSLKAPIKYLRVE